MNNTLNVHNGPEFLANRNRDSSASNLTNIASKDDSLPREVGRLSRVSSRTGSFRRKFGFDSSFRKKKRSSCKCKNKSVFNLVESEPKEMSSVIKYLRVRKVYVFLDTCLITKFHKG